MKIDRITKSILILIVILLVLILAKEGAITTAVNDVNAQSNDKIIQIMGPSLGGDFEFIYTLRQNGEVGRYATYGGSRRGQEYSYRVVGK